MMASRRKTSLAAVLAAGFALAAIAGGTAAAGAGVTAIVPSQSVFLESDYADDIADQKEQQEENEKARDELDAELEHTNAQIVAANNRLKDLNARLPKAEEELALAEAALDEALQNLAAAQAKLDAAEAEDARLGRLIAADEQKLADLEAILAELARSAYRGNNSNATLELVLGASTAQEFVDDYTTNYTIARTQGNALAQMEQIAAQNRNRGDRQAAVRERVAELQQIAQDYADEAEAARSKAEARKQEIEDLLQEQQELKAYLQEQKKAFLAEQKKLEEEGLKIRKELQRLIALQDGTVYGDGTWGYPVTPVHVTSPYGYRIHPIYHVRRLHAGTDFRAACGQKVYAAADGKIEWRYYRGGYGNQIMMSHGKIGGKTYNSSYNHLSKFAVDPGDLVVRGELIGYAGTTGDSIGCHLHFEVYVNGNTVDPMTILPK